MWLCEGPCILYWKFHNSCGRTAPSNTRPHRTTPDPHRPIPDKKWLIVSLRRVLRVELKGVKRRVNYSQSTKGMNSSRRSWWVGFEVGMDGKLVKCGIAECGKENVESKNKMWNDADWSRRQTTRPLSFHSLPHRSLNWQCGKMQTSSAENDI